MCLKTLFQCYGQQCMSLYFRYSKGLDCASKAIQIAHITIILFQNKSPIICTVTANCNSHCVVVPGGCEQLFCDPTSLPDQCLTLRSDTSQLFVLYSWLACHSSECALHIYALLNRFLSTVSSLILVTFVHYAVLLMKIYVSILISVFLLTPNWILTFLEHVVPVDPQRTFSVITRKFTSAVLLPHAFLKERWYDEIVGKGTEIIQLSALYWIGKMT